MKLDELIKEAQDVRATQGNLEVRAYYWDNTLNVETETYLHMLSRSSKDRAKGVLTLEMEETPESAAKRKH